MESSAFAGTVKCARRAPAAFPDAEAAFAAYVPLANNARWCEAINSFELPARDEAAVSAFWTLLLMAVSDGPLQQSYKKQFDAFCESRQLHYDERDLVRISLMAISETRRKSGEPPNPALARERAAVTKAPEQTYVDLMTTISQVDPKVLVTFDPRLQSVEMGAEGVVGAAQRSDGRVAKVSFRQTASGWVLSLIE